MDRNVMECCSLIALPQHFLGSCIAAIALLVGQWLLRRWRLPRLPLGLALLALAAWALLPLSGALPWQGMYQAWIQASVDFLVALAALRLGLWLTLELPSGLGWWGRPPELMLQLLMLCLGAVIAVVVVRESTRFDLVGLVTTSAVLTAVLGLAAQETLKDLFAGLELQLGDDFGVGDWLELSDGAQGVVESITWRDTKLRNMDGCTLIIPNSKITAEVINNRSARGMASNRFEIGLDYSFPPAQARRLLDNVLRQHPLVLLNPPPRVRLKSFGDSAIVYDLQVWQKKANLQAVLELRSELQEQLWYALERAGQSIPYPIRELQPRRKPVASASSNPTADLHNLRANGLFVVLSPEQQEQMLSQSAPLRFGPGELIVCEGDIGDCLYLIKRGSVDVIKHFGEPRQTSLAQLRAGEVFGEMTLLLDEPRSATVQALEECQLLEVNRQCLKSLLDDNPELLERLANQVQSRKSELEQLQQNKDVPSSDSLLNSMRRLFQAITGSKPSDALH
jgi:small-conductance mechanosensitive channel/CRP-like cAMP-binding protein